MQIRNIKKLRNFGIFQNHTNSDAKDFGRYNLFYGWNGSGKSTLSDLFRHIENRGNLKKFPTSEFTVCTDDGTEITQSNVTESSVTIYTFNHDFISENISWDNVVKRILLIDKTKIEEREKYETLIKDHEKEKDALHDEIKHIAELERAISKFETDSARHLKASLQSIDTSDTYYLNYDKRKFESFIKNNTEATKDESSTLSPSKVIELTKSAKAHLMSSLQFSNQPLRMETFTKAKERLNDLLRSNVVSKTIDRLVESPALKAWVEVGLDLHKKEDTNQCEFCGNILTQERRKELEAHFNDDYKAFQDRLVKADSWISEQQVTTPTLPAPGDIYEEFRSELSEARKLLEQATSALNEKLSDWHSTLKLKISNPFETNLSVDEVDATLISNFNDATTRVSEIIAKHNHKSKNFKDETNAAKRALELHYATTEVISFGYHTKKAGLEDLIRRKDTLELSINQRNLEIRKLESSLSNEGLGAAAFNKNLSKFLGRSELSLRFNSQKKGYEILRNNSELIDGKLSEGEKTAIAFVYFITKLKENNNKMENIIVVVDDPVSSFDSNHLFHAYSFLRSNCESAKQLFVLTHNFTYFKLIRDWFAGINKNRAKKNKNPTAFIYTIEASTTNPRQSTYKNADASLAEYNSEYHYIFSTLYKLKNKDSLSREEAFLTANLSRKLIESFFCFKYPKNRGDLATLMQSGLNGCIVTDAIIKEKIYRFINKYSHSLVIEVNEDFSENLVGESQNVIKDIFTWIQEVDKIHFEEMVSIMDISD